MQVLQLSSLEILDFRKNKIDTVPEEIGNLTSLKVLAISKNRIDKLPLCLGDLGSLHVLKFDGNPIELPSEVTTIKRDSPSTTEYERDAVLTAQVKRYLRSRSTRERLRVESEGETRLVNNISFSTTLFPVSHVSHFVAF